MTGTFRGTNWGRGGGGCLSLDSDAIEASFAPQLYARISAYRPPVLECSASTQRWRVRCPEPFSLTTGGEFWRLRWQIRWQSAYLASKSGDGRPGKTMTVSNSDSR